MLAQRYPEAYDGIAASAPAINWSEFIVGDYWPQLQMNLRGQYPRNCELNQVVSASIRACDPLDGVVDGLISDIDSCTFDPFSVVGTSFNCTDTGLEMEISRAAAIVMNATWTGAHTPDGSFLWYGPLRGANVTGAVDTIVDTTCTNSGICAGKPNYLATSWMQGWLKRDLNANLITLSLEDYTRLFKDGVEYFQSLIETNNPDLSLFKARGGKLIGYHGLVR
jgi:feruloyl esterase